MPLPPPGISMQEWQREVQPRHWTEALSLTIEVYGEEAIHLHESSYGYWYSTKRPHLLLDQAMVAISINSFSRLAATEVFVDEYDDALLEELQLYPARAAITVEYHDTTYTVYIGARTVDNNFYYIMIYGSPTIYLINPWQVSSFFRGYDIIADRLLPLLNPLEMVSIEINRRGHDPIYIQRQPDSHFFEGDALLSPIQLVMQTPLYAPALNLHYSFFRHLDEMANPHQHGGLLVNLVELNPEDLTVYGLDDPQLEIIIEMSNEYIFHLTIGNTSADHSGRVYATFGGLDGVWTAQSTLLFALFDMDPRIAVFNSFIIEWIWDADRIELGLASGNFDIMLEHSFSPPEIEGNRDIHHLIVTINGELLYDPDPAFRSFYARLTGLQSEGITTMRVPEGEPLEWVRYHMNDGRVLELRFFHYNAAFYGVSFNGGNITYLISRYSLGTLNNSLYTLLNR